MIAMVVVGPMIKRVDARYLNLAGLMLDAILLYIMSGFSLGMDEMLIIESGFIQGLGTGLMFVPLSTIAFATLESRFRNEGAAMFNLIRNIGSAIGISALQAMTVRNDSTVHSRLVEGIRPDNTALSISAHGFDLNWQDSVDPDWKGGDV